MASDQENRATAGQDPRIDERDVRPVVDRPRSGLSGPAIGALAVVAGLGLFGVLEARRQTVTAPAVGGTVDDQIGSIAPPPLYVPPAPAAPVATFPAPFTATTPTRTVDRLPPATSVPSTIASRQSSETPSAPVSSGYTPPGPSFANTPAPVRAAPRSVSGQALIVDSSTEASSAAPESKGDTEKAGDPKQARLSTTRARAAMLANRSTTVPQGTLIPAVLETAFDSTSPGFARALVQRDIYGFDGTQVLIPRGSRLIGEYGADTERGQARAVILWARLIRPDGVTIAIGSPAADTLGRGGVKADVNSHFLERFSGAILQSALDVGVNLAARNSRSPVIVALPSTGSAVTSAATARTADVTPTLRVPAGRSVSVFVARDLDFTAAGSTR
ncbi:TrbI/VirB10 family protein [Sphingomonas sp. S-NIH.Pt15_0812]|uniref:TrbI/VirB10 family protein n=1 Tax=Sphingomonas sp. S-NIH.Pt15_0812 TaxID=1920129 RepID=UPI001F49A0E8|nr:TrbI/VirB10 family protein [Sphingomonas sp. S-NIH.Pt15_0812]